MILSNLTRRVAHAPRFTLAIALAALVLFGIFGAPVVTELPAGGYDNESSESFAAEKVLSDTFGAGGMSLLFTVSSDKGVDNAEVQSQARAILEKLNASQYVSHSISYWTTPQNLASGLVSADRHTGVIAAQIDGTDTEAPSRAHELAEDLIGTRDGVTVTAGGYALAQDQINRQSRTDLVVMESIAVPFTFAVLVWIFGSAIAAMIPLAAAGFSLIGTAFALRLLHHVVDVSVFSLNLATALCMSLAVDYTLFIINRYREEVDEGHTRNQAIIRTMTTAGKTVIYSGLTLALTMSTMVLFPGYFLKSLAYAGIAGVAFSLIAALLIAPALIVVLGDRIDSLDVRRPINRWLRRPPPTIRPPEERLWYRTAMFAMRRSTIVAVLVTGLFIALSLPALGLKLGYPDERSLPSSASARQVGDTLREEFTQQQAGSVWIVLPSGITSAKAITNYAEDLSRVDGVTAVAAPGGIFVDGAQVSIVTSFAEQKGDAAYLTVSTEVDPFSASGKDQLAALKRVPAPATALFSGLAQRNFDNVSGVTSKVPLVLLLIAAMTSVLMFLMTGSVLMPIKALLLNSLSLAATFGILTWIFQDGHLGTLGTTSPGYLNASILPLMSCIAFGLAMDYEVFVLSRVREEWLKSGKTEQDNQRAVAIGLAHTGRVVTAAATVMAVVFCALMASGVSFNRMLGFGLAIGIILDAFLIRTLLVPAVMRIAGRANWWAPGPLARWHSRWGIDETPRSDQPLVRRPDSELVGKS